MDKYSEAVLAKCQIDPNVRYGFVAVEKLDKNSL